MDNNSGTQKLTERKELVPSVRHSHSRPTATDNKRDDVLLETCKKIFTLEFYVCRVINSHSYHHEDAELHFKHDLVALIFFYAPHCEIKRVVTELTTSQTVPGEQFRVGEGTIQQISIRGPNIYITLLFT